MNPLMVFRNLKFSVLVLVLGISAQLLAQDPAMNSAKKAFNGKQYPKVVKMAESALKKDKTQAEWYYLKAAAEYVMSHMSKYQGGSVNYFKEAVKDAVKGREKDPEGNLVGEYLEYFEKIVDENNKEAMANYNRKSYAKAVQGYKNSYDLTGDTTALAWLGMSYYMDHKLPEALPLLKEVTVMNYYAYLDGSGEGTYVREPFEVLSNFYLDKNQADTSRYYTEMGLKVFPMNRVLLANEKSMLKGQLIGLARMGAINSKYKEVVNSGLKFFPADTFFRIQQNYYYLTKLMQATQAKPYDSADALTDEFYKGKKSAIDAGIVNGADEFLIKDYNKFNFQLLDYFLRTNTDRTAPFFFRKWYAMQFKYAEFDEKLSESLLKSPPDSVSHRLISMLFNDVLEDYPWNKKIKQYRLDYFNKWVKKKVHRGELESLIAMNDALIKDFPLDKTLKPTLQNLLVRQTDSSIRHRELYDAWAGYYRIKADFPAYNTDALQKNLAMTDFQERYSATRVYYKTVAGKKIANTGWDGNSKDCNSGHMPDSTLYNVINRINYYRQNAGIVLPMDLNRQKSRKCQEAATMYAPKGIFTREPTEATHTCYTKGAAEAAQVAQCILESNPAQCVTIFMNDNKSEELINRRAILNPEGLEAGFGSAENCSVFWLLDLSGAPDSAWYQTHFVAWPPPGYSPKMLLFNKWSFSIADDLTDAKVTMKNKAGEDVSVVVTQFPIAGMLLNTLVMSPYINPKLIAADEVFEVTVELKNKKKYSYKVMLF